MCDSERATDTPPSHHRPGGGFRNPWPNSAPGGYQGLLKWILIERGLRKGAREPDHSRFQRVAPTIVHPHVAPDTIAVTWIGHATVLLQLGELNILTDPVWSERASPLQFSGPKRWVAPGAGFDALPPIDLVLLSHNHYDHLDDRTVRRLAERWPESRWLAPLGLARFVRARGARHVEELDWWQQTRVGPATIACTPAQHFSARGLADRNATLWCGWSAVVGQRRVFFAGDTGYHPEFGMIAERYGPFDLALLPIGAYEPRWFMHPVHMNPDDAVAAFRDLRSRADRSARSVMVPIHWGTFKLTDEPMDEPPRRVRTAWDGAGLPAEDLWLLAHGETRVLGGAGYETRGA
jgi:N-acyl-phosphatidylethanolamine-hydrolysing phospholipase D